MASSLHNHSEYSVLDGFSHPKEYLDRAKEIGLKAFAITEHGNQYSWVYFDKLKHDYQDIKMIYGVELYECFDMSIKDSDSKYFHLIALAMNERGRIGINEIITKSNFEGFYYKPRIDIRSMQEYADDIIVLSACLASKIAREQNYDKCLEYVKEYKDIFPHFYLEMQSHEHPDQVEYNNKVLRLSNETNTPYVITTDSHAATKEDLYYQGRHVQIARDDDTLTELYEGCYLQSESEIHAVMDKQIGVDAVNAGIRTSDEIADMIDNVDMPFQNPTLPTYPLPEGFETNFDYLKHLCEVGWHNRKIDEMPEEEQRKRRERLDYELGIIHQMGFDGYFLFVWDFIDWSRHNDVYTGPGRGCFVPDSKVLLSNGKCKNIQDVVIGDNVVTHLGNIKTVLNTFAYDCNEEMIEIKYSDSTPIRCTKDHKIFALKQSICYRYYKNPGKTRKFCSPTCKSYGTCKYQNHNKPEWVPANELRANDYVCYPKSSYLTNGNVTIDLSKLDNSILHDDNEVWYEDVLTGREKIRLNRFIKIDEKFCMLAGWFISQGWSRYREGDSYEIGFAHHSDKKELIEKNVTYLKDVFGKNCHVQEVKHKDKQVVRIIANYKILSLLFSGLFCKGAENKQIPDVMMRMDSSNTQALIKGLWDGDGTYKISYSMKTKYSTVNYNLAKQVQMLLSKENFCSRIGIHRHENTDWNDEIYVEVSGKENVLRLNKLCNNEMSFDREYGTNATRNYSDGKYCYYKIQDINKFKYDGKVYDLSVEDDCSFVVESAAVHNSGGGSIVDYLLNISQLDPISFDLIFERFLNPERVSMPDIDSDFSDRDKVVRYLEHKFGVDRVCQIINYSYITPVVAIKDVGRVLGIPYATCDKISKKFTYPIFEECIENNPDLLTTYPEHSDLFDIAGKISGRVRQVSIHAGGVGIVDTKITDYMAMKVGSRGEHVIQVDKRLVEEIGIIKYDLLGLADTLNTIKYAVKYAGIEDSELDINNPEFFNNKDMYNLLCSANVDGVFQVESQGMKDLLVRMQPSNFEDVSAVLALYRPDTMGALNDYIEHKHGISKTSYIHEDMRRILEPTYGCLIYQEQLMDIVRTFGGRTYGGADKFRKAIGKKNIELVKQESAKLYQEIIDNGYSEEIARKISDDMSEKGGLTNTKYSPYKR